jgi:hypothetical protein
MILIEYSLKLWKLMTQLEKRLGLNDENPELHLDSTIIPSVLTLMLKSSVIFDAFCVPLPQNAAPCFQQCPVALGALLPPFYNHMVLAAGLIPELCRAWESYGGQTRWVGGGR